MILDAAREREHRANKFAAALKGINLDAENQEDGKEAFDRVQRRVQAKLTGQQEAAIELDELDFDFELEE